MENHKKVIEQYLNSHFAGAEIRIVRGQKDDAFLCHIQDSDGEAYELVVMDEALSGNPEEMLALLERYGPAQVLREVVGFPITVTRSGCIIGC